MVTRCPLVAVSGAIRVAALNGKPPGTNLGRFARQVTDAESHGVALSQGARVTRRLFELDS